ncbi:hypothetical protein DVW05_16635 [Clostridium botulinum]|nr:hypothetical protein [Clostridium botulinum]
MNKSRKLLNCILGSILLILLNCPISFNAVSRIRYIGYILGDILNLISFLGVILTIIFSIMLIKENCKYNE